MGLPLLSEEAVMKYVRSPLSPTVKQQGAAAGSILQGASASNKGLRLRVCEEQPRGQDGPLRGDFVILEAGDNKHASSLEAFRGRTTNAQEVLAAIRLDYAACVNVANTNILVPEADGAGGIPKK
jgi:hypothetical protein